ncbi:MAG: mandelate racemase/muconate lactonizing enzyme family protein [Chloroflexi bacterium]|nr:mandelate racemase/muconate lactonizing enzyme family protein [Chloroflexota bacterium]
MPDSTIVDLRYFLVHPTPPDTGQPDRYIAGKNLCFVRLETADGLHGWGECYTQSDRDIQITAHLEAMRRYIVGWDSARIKPWTDAIHNDFGNRRGAMDLYSAISGVEQAMWDIAGKRAGMPVHQLLGGAVRDRLRVYANGWAKMDDIEELQARARAMVDRGFTALKFDPVPGKWRSYVGMKQLRLAADRVRAVREAVGPDVDVLLEIHRRLSPSNAVRLSQMVEEYEPFWFEEPVWAENMTALAAATAQINIPTVTGEELYTKFEFREAFEQRAADIINPDVANVGGIKELTEIAAMAEIYFVAVAPHNYNSTTMALASTLTAPASKPNFIIN